METTLKQRLIGAAVIIALAVIFLPIILDGSGHRSVVNLELETPPEPKFNFESKLPDPKKLEELPAKHVIKKEVEEPKEKAEADKKQETKTKAAKKDEQKVVVATADLIKTNPSLSAWAVQVAAFSEKEKAQALQKKLRDAKFPAFTEETRAEKNKIVYRVKVGPELEKDKAEKLKEKIVTEQGLQGSFVTSHP